MFTVREMFASLAPFFNFGEMFTALAPFFTAAVVIVLSPFVHEHIPSAVSDYLVSIYQNWLSRFSREVTVVIKEKDSLKSSNQICEAASAYLRTRISEFTKPRRFKVCKEDGQNESTIDIVEEEKFTDKFNDIILTWKLCDGKKRYFELSFDKKFEKEVLESYLPHILTRYQNDNSMVKLFTRDNKYSDVRWVHIILKHPFMFENLAMDPKKKKMLLDDLNTFRGRKDLYENVGKAWKRGYLLYGPPGTGKSSLIAAMANHLKFNIYDLNLTGRYTDDDLRSILLSTANRSILVFEDIDRGVELDDPRREIDAFTLSGLLNMIDGLWSSCGEERIIVFTANDIDKLDPALLRPGRMDLHVHMSYCTIDGFKVLATNYLKIECDHKLYIEIEGLLENVEVTAAEIAEELLKRCGTGTGTDDVLQGVVEFLKKKEREKANAAELKESLKERLRSADIDVDAEGLAKFFEKKKFEKAKAAKAEQLLNSRDTDVEELVKFFKQKKLEDDARLQRQSV